MTGKEIIKRLIELSFKEADKAADVKRLQERRNGAQLQCHEAEVALGALQNERAALVAEMGWTSPDNMNEFLAALRGEE